MQLKPNICCYYLHPSYSSQLHLKSHQIIMMVFDAHYNYLQPSSNVLKQSICQRCDFSGASSQGWKFWDLRIALPPQSVVYLLGQTVSEMPYCICFRLFLIYTSSMRNNHTWEGIQSRTLQMKCMRSGLPSEVHLPQSSGSSPSPRSLLSAHIPVYLHPRW